MYKRKNKVLIRILSVILCFFLLMDGGSMFVLAEGASGENANEMPSESTQESEEDENFENGGVEEQLSDSDDSLVEEHSSEAERIEEEEESETDKSELSSEEFAEGQSEEVSESMSEESEEEPTTSEEEFSDAEDSEETEEPEDVEDNTEEISKSNVDVLLEGAGENTTVIATDNWFQVVWSVSSDGELNLQAPKKSYVLQDHEEITSYPWDAYRDQITSIHVDATIIFKCNDSYLEQDVMRSGYNFKLYKNLEEVSFGKNFDGTQITSFALMFSRCEKLKKVDLSNVDSSQSIDFTDMFFNCKSLKDVNLSELETNNALLFNRMFECCSSIESIDISTFNVGKLKEINNMFRECTSLKNLNLGKLTFSNVEECSSVFAGCKALEELDLHYWCIKYIQAGTFFRTDSLVKIITPAQMERACFLAYIDDEYTWIREDTGEIIRSIPKETESLVINRIPVIPIEKIVVARDSFEMGSGTINFVGLKIYPEDATYKELVTSQQGDNCASVKLKEGEYYISTYSSSKGKAIFEFASQDFKGVKKTIEVNVVRRADKYIPSFDAIYEDGEYIFFKGKEYKPQIEWKMGEAWPEYIMEFENDTVVEKDGKLVPKECGSGTVTFYVTQYEEKYKPVEIKYRVYDLVEGIDMGSDQFILESSRGIDQMTITGTYTNSPDKTVYGNIVYTMSKNSNFWMQDNGDNTITVGVYENKPGKVSITASTSDRSGVKKVFTVCNGSFVSGVKVSAALDFDANGNYLLRKGSSVKLVTEVLPKEATNKKLVFSSSDETIATVDSKGVVKARKEGSVIITATATDESGVSAECRINVTGPAKKVIMSLKENGANKVFFAGEEPVLEFAVDTVVMADDTTEGVAQEVDYTISGSGAKNVVYKGNHVFEASAPGIVTIKATTKDGSKKSASIKVAIEQGVYAFDVLAPKNMGSYIDETGNEHWIVNSGKKNIELKPQVVYNNASKERPADKANQKYEISISENAKESVLLNKSGTGVVISKNAVAGNYEVIFTNVSSGISKRILIDVVPNENAYIKTIDIAYPANVKAISDSAQPLAAGSKIKLAGILNNGEKISGYTLEWKILGEGNEGSATIKDGLLDLKNAVPGDRYTVILTIMRNGESKSATKEILVTQKVRPADIKVVTPDEQAIELPASITVQSELNNKIFRVTGLDKDAELYRVSGGKKGVLNVKEEAEGFSIQAVGIGTAKISITMLDGSNVKKDITIKVVSANNPVTKINTGVKTYYVLRKEPIAIPYTLSVKKEGNATDPRVEWKVSSENVLKVSSDITKDAGKSCITTEEKGYLWLVPATEMTGKVTVTGTTLDGNKKSIKITVYVVNNSKCEVPDSFDIKVPANQPTDIYARPIVLHGKSMKLQTIYSSAKVKNKNIIYSLTGINKKEQMVTESELKSMGVTLKNGKLSVAKNCTFHGVVTVRASLDYKVYRNGELQEVYTEEAICVQPAAEVKYVYYYSEDGEKELLSKGKLWIKDGMALYVDCSNGVNNVRVKWETNNPQYGEMKGNVFKGYSTAVSENKNYMTLYILDGSKQKISYLYTARKQ